MKRSGITELYESFMTFVFLEKFPFAFIVGLLSQCKNWPFLVFLYEPSQRQRSYMIFICILLIMSENENFFHMPVNHLYVFFGRSVCLFPHMIYGWGIVFYYGEFMSALEILDINAFAPKTLCANIFFHLVGYCV